MHKMKIILMLIFLILPTICSGAEYTLPGYIFIGEIPVECEMVDNPEGTVETPAGFKISPHEAMNIAIENTRIKCVSKLQQVIYADSKNYYIFNSVVLTHTK